MITAMSMRYDGIALAPGIAIGKVLPLHSSSRSAVPEKVGVSDVQAEIDRFFESLKETEVQIAALRDELKTRLDAKEAGIFDAHLMLCSDQSLINGVRETISSESCCAEYAVYEVSEKFYNVMSNIPDAYLRERAGDIRDVASRIIANITDREMRSLGMDDKRIIISHTLVPSETATLDKKKILGIVVETGGETSHTAILARSLGLPAVAGVPGELIDSLRISDRVIVDGFKGRVIINPDSHIEESYRLKAQAADKLRNELASENTLFPDTTDGFRVQIAANIESHTQMPELRASGARGVGLFRTEFLFLNQVVPPDEDSQFEIYKQLLLAADDEPVTIRVMDIGGDKLPRTGTTAVEDNPFLGLRGIRFCLYGRRDLFEVQLRALLRAGVFGNLKVLLPMVSSVAEVLETREIIRQLQEQLASEQKEFVSNLSLGVMIETPVAALQAEHLAGLVDFFSIGTNDLVQYTMAIDRGNEQVAYLYRPANPSVLKLIRNVVEVAEAHRIHAGVCGQMAADPIHALLLLGLGVHELSMAPSAVPVVRRAVRSVSMYELEQLAARALGSASAAEAVSGVHQLLSERAPELIREK